ncbi:N(4)-acetylcytidine aminohydrolase [Entomohabitans teleogrylli]|uniref:N(4)-acetylcytidine aminohydrolase n=1 Tax=Entomohabitans teleogrylli TaxID=1384589 RepID=UPI00073D7CC0|nr:N(4)-acetylcytidine aminohydrolase [Entomohabitans teleogrylli]
MANDMTFYRRFAADILAGKKTITIRDRSESHFRPGERLRVGYDDDDSYFCTIEINSVTPITQDALTVEHARQENMTLDELKAVIRDIYPDTDALYVVAFRCL